MRTSTDDKTVTLSRRPALPAVVPTGLPVPGCAAAAAAAEEPSEDSAASDDDDDDDDPGAAAGPDLLAVGDAAVLTVCLQGAKG